MKYNETHFSEYINSCINNPLIKTEYIENDFSKLDNIILYGPPGIGKYSQSLMLIKNFSASKLKYEKKIELTFNKNVYYIKISDIHYEIDMSNLGCNAKLLWYEIYNKIIDIISLKNEKNGIILCKYFHEIHNELLENFYSYMQILYNTDIQIKFILITEHISFIPDNIINYCKHIKLKRPVRTSYNKCFKTNFTINDDISLILNIKDIKDKKNKKDILGIFEQYKSICDNIIENILNIDTIKFINLREKLYEICIYNHNIYNCILYILKSLIEKEKIDKKKLNNILIETYNFFKLYNNNYRPIYHLERYILYITATVNEL
jgi:hypothetical protein